MPDKPGRIRLQELQSFLDSDLQPERRNIIAEVIEKRPDLKAQVEEWRRVPSDLHAAYDSVLDEPIPQELLEVLSGREEE